MRKTHSDTSESCDSRVEARFTAQFERALKKKKRRQQRLAVAVYETVERLLQEPESPGLNTHLVDRDRRIWEAYVNSATRLTFERDGDNIVFRNNCRHDIIDRRQW